MAKTTLDYRNEGAQDFKEGRVRPVGTSWQAKAKLEGFEQAEFECAEADAVAIAEEKEMHSDIVKIDRSIKKRNQHTNTINAIRSHIQTLKDKVESMGEWDSPKFERYCNKIVKLNKKHGPTHHDFS